MHPNSDGNHQLIFRRRAHPLHDVENRAPRGSAGCLKVAGRPAAVPFGKTWGGTRLPRLFRGNQLQRDIVRVPELQDIAEADIFDFFVHYTAGIEMRGSGFQFSK